MCISWTRKGSIFLLAYLQRLLLVAWTENGAITYVVDGRWVVGVGCKFAGQPTVGLQSDICSRIAECQNPFHLSHPVTFGKDSSVSITRDTLHVGRSGERYPLEASFSAPLPRFPGPQSASYTMDIGSLSRG